ncbi:hypothetical protein JKG47_16780 [Acidithiobacillus sp. MC6.1]|uniref:Uncharacterized protein n=1 Tax=Acidithiobacillus ferrivorans TaxID=160808 RepID=A0A1B9BX34_9PROT|nr:hypothetical protein [Acidithiobacillus ferrivorans]MBN6742152.1 hypothetical protein [Acidithiobacillus sp. MC6.1]OCB02288.1 hypothetical protein BBC27_13880 [Acidithiobacillus ferrivorans]
MQNPFFQKPILNSPYGYPQRHWELDEQGQPTQRISDWEGEFCRVVEEHPRVCAYVKNHNLGFEVPYRYGFESRIVEIKGYRGEDAKDKKAIMDTYRVPDVNNLGSHGRWAFAEFTDVWLMQEDFVRQIALFFDRTIASVVDSHLSGAMSCPS